MRQNNTHLQKTISASLLALGAFATNIFTTSAHAEITNKALDPEFAGDSAAAKSGSLFVDYFIYIWNVLMVVGGLVVLLFFIQAAIEWITAGGDSGKIQKARDRMVQSVIGLVILVFSFVIVNFISSLLFAGTGFDILRLDLPTPGIT